MARRKNDGIKTKVELAGEREYNAALDAITRNLNTMKTALKAETAELGANATAQQKNEARIKSLKKQIAEQEKAVATLKKAFEEAKRDYGDNEDVVQKWEQKLNTARSTLAGMQNDLESLSASMEGVTDATEMGVVATKSFADTVESIGTVCSSVADGIEGIFRGMIGAVESAAVELWDFIGTTAAKANNYVDIAGYWNTDAATIEQYANAVKDASGNFEDLQTVVSRLVLGGKGDKIAEYLGISDVNYENEWDYAMAAMQRMYELREKGELADGFWEDVFGEKKATKVMDLLNDWGTVLDKLDDYDADNGGFGMGSDALETMSAVWDKMNSIQTMWEALQDQIAAGLGTVTMPLMVDVQGGLTALNDYLKADSDEARQAALDALVGSIESFFTHLGEALAAGIDKLREVADALQESDNPGVRALGDALDFIADGLEWIVEHADEVKKALEAMFGLWLVMKLGAIAAMVTGIVAKIEVIKGFQALKSGAAAVGEKAVETATGGGASTAAGMTLGGVLSKVLPLVPAVMAVSEELRNPASKMAQFAYENAVWQDRESYMRFYEGEDENKAQIELLADTLADALEERKDESYDRGFGGEAESKALRDWFREYGADALQMAPDAAFWDIVKNAVDLDDGLSAAEIERIATELPDTAWTTFAGDLVETLDSRLMELNTTISGGDATYNPEVAQNIVDSVSGVSGTLSALPGSFASAVARALSGVKVYLDGEAVGRLTTNTVSMGIAGRVISEIK